MRILFVSNYWPPEKGAASRLGMELCKALAADGHQIEVVTGFPRYKMTETPAEYAGKPHIVEDVQGIRTIRVPLPHASRDRAIQRGIDWLLLPRAVKKGIKMAGEADVVYTVLPPITMAHAAAYAAKTKNAPLVTMYGDIFPNNVIELGALSNPTLIKYCRKLEQFAYRVANKIIVHSDCYKDYMVSDAGVPADKVEVVFNWADTEAIQPRERENEFRAEHELQGKFIVSYAGTMGPAQGLQIAFEAAELLKEYKDIHFLIAGDGQDRERLVRLLASSKLTNVTFLPSQPLSKYIQLMAASDVCLVTLDPKVKAPTVPSKIWEIMASGRPVLASVALDGDAPKIIERANAGISVEPGNAQAMADAILKIRNEPKLAQDLGTAGRTFAEEFASITPCSQAYLRVFEAALSTKKS